jgi:hypothetical protein
MSGIAVAYGEMVRDLGKALSAGQFDLMIVRSLIVSVVRDGAWRDFIVPATGEHVTYKPDQFVLFVTAPPFRGLGADLALVEDLCADDVAATTMLRQAKDAGKRQGARTDLRNNITEVPPRRLRGTAREYALVQLAEARPDLHARVCGGELSANAAAIEAGFRKRATPLDTLRKAWGAANQDERAAFLAEVRD